MSGGLTLCDSSQKTVPPVGEAVAPTANGISYQGLLNDPIDCVIFNVDPCDMAEEQKQCPDIGDLYRHSAS